MSRDNPGAYADTLKELSDRVDLLESALRRIQHLTFTGTSNLDLSVRFEKIHKVAEEALRP